MMAMESSTVHQMPSPRGELALTGALSPETGVVRIKQGIPFVRSRGPSPALPFRERELNLVRVIGPRVNDIAHRGCMSTTPSDACASRMMNHRGASRCNVRPRSSVTSVPWPPGAFPSSTRSRSASVLRAARADPVLGYLTATSSIRRLATINRSGTSSSTSARSLRDRHQSSDE